MIELEDIVARKNYKFKIDWSCDTCGKDTFIYGVSLKGEPSYGKHQITWNEIIHKKCNVGHMSIPVRTCTRCNKVYDFEETSCKDCDSVIYQMLSLELEYVELTQSIRKMKRKKQEIRAEEIRLSEVIHMLEYLGYKPCDSCNKVTVGIGETECNNCEI